MDVRVWFGWYRGRNFGFGFEVGFLGGLELIKRGYKCCLYRVVSLSTVLSLFQQAFVVDFGLGVY